MGARPTESDLIGPAVSKGLDKRTSLPLQVYDSICDANYRKSQYKHQLATFLTGLNIHQSKTSKQRSRNIKQFCDCFFPSVGLFSFKSNDSSMTDMRMSCHLYQALKKLKCLHQPTFKMEFFKLTCKTYAHKTTY